MRHIGWCAWFSSKACWPCWYQQLHQRVVAASLTVLSLLLLACDVGLSKRCAGANVYVIARGQTDLFRVPTAAGRYGEAYSRANFRCGLFQNIAGSKFDRILSRCPGSLNCVPVLVPGTLNPLQPAWMLGLVDAALLVPASRQKKGRFPRRVMIEPRSNSARPAPRQHPPGG